MAELRCGVARYSIAMPDGQIHQIAVKGRNRWALDALIDAGTTGCTPLHNPAPRWSAYVWNLRQMGLHIDTVHEHHDGPYSGTHGRYVLRCTVTRLPGVNA